MFAESMLETSWAQRGQRSWTTFTSFAVQVVAVGIVLSIPLIQGVGIPLARTVSTPVTLGRYTPGLPPSADPAHAAPRPHTVQIIPYSGPLMQPRNIPTGIAKGDDSVQVGDPMLPGVYSPNGPGLNINLPTSGNNVAVPVPPPPKPATREFRSSKLLQGSLIRRVEPVYPPLARNMRIEGPVVLDALISKDGSMDHLRVVSGHPLLVPAAIDAVKQWHYKPYILNSEAIEVETQITVNFILAK
jgi:periplasmic protein TonB